MRRWEVIFVYLLVSYPAALCEPRWLRALAFGIAAVVASAACELLEGYRRRRAEGRWRSLMDVFS